MPPMWECDWHCGNFYVVQRDLRAARRQPWNSCGRTACSSVPETVPEVCILRPDASSGKEVQSSFQYFFLFHKGNFCPFPLTIFILYLNHAWPHVDACGFFPHWKVLLWLISTNRTFDRQTCLQKYRANARINQQKVYTLTGAAQKNSRRFLKQKAKLAALTSVLTSKTHSLRRHLCRPRNSGATIGKGFGRNTISTSSVATLCISTH